MRSIGVEKVQNQIDHHLYRDWLKSLYVVARNFFLLLLNFSAWPCSLPMAKGFKEADSRNLGIKLVTSPDNAEFTCKRISIAL